MKTLASIAVGLIGAVAVASVLFYAGVKQGRAVEHKQWKAWQKYFHPDTWYIDGAYYPEPKYLIPETEDVE